MKNNRYEYIPIVKLYSIVTENQEELMTLLATSFDGNSKIDDMEFLLIKSLYNYNITGDKLKKLWDHACLQNPDIFKLTLCLLSSYDSGIQYQEDKNAVEQKADEILDTYIEKNMERDEPIPFIEDTDIDCKQFFDVSTNTSSETWNEFHRTQAKYLIKTLEQEKVYTR